MHGWLGRGCYYHKWVWVRGARYIIEHVYPHSHGQLEPPVVAFLFFVSHPPTPGRLVLPEPGGVWGHTEVCGMSDWGANEVRTVVTHTPLGLQHLL